MPVLLEERKEQRQEREIELRNARFEIATSRRQRQQMVIALAILVIAIVLLMVKDWQVVSSWFSSPQPQTQSEALEHSVVATTPPASQAKTENRSTKQAPAPAPPPESVAPVVMTNRAALPPLEIEVVAGNHRRSIKPSGSSSLKVDMQEGDVPAPAPAPVQSAAVESSPQTPSTNNTVVNASESVHMSQDTVQAVSRPVQPSYPLLAKQMKVQGSVVLQALIGKAGAIEDLQVLSGPAILSSAAMEAVRQWRFRPYYVNGETVETQAKITVNFTISTY
ncbi:MAG TPA: TonB family protein [Terriglobales bacterium]|jgi:protein TonB